LQKKSLVKIQHPFKIKALTKLVIGRMYLNLIKAIYYKPIANIIVNKEKLKPFPLKSGMRLECGDSLHTYPIWS
jgi:hypothetical protein